MQKCQLHAIQAATAADMFMNDISNRSPSPIRRICEDVNLIERLMKRQGIILPKIMVRRQAGISEQYLT